jgi:two-component system nitrate/nitrite response regulator NarL
LKSPAEKPMRVLIADAHTLFRAGLRRLLDNSRTGLVVVGDVADGRDAVRQVSLLKPDIFVFDLLLPKLAGLEVLRQLQPMRTLRKVILTAQITEQDRLKASDLGVSCVLSKQSSMEELLQCIRRLGKVGSLSSATTERSVAAPLDIPRRKRRGQPFQITEREMQVLAALAEGLTNAAIGTRLSISTETVKHHLTNLFNKTGASNRLELMLFATEKELLEKSRFSIGITAVAAALTAKRNA